MTVEPHSRTTTELAAEVEAGNRETPGWCVRCGHADVCHDKGGACSFPSGCDCPAMLTTEEVSAALAELRSRAEQQPSNPDIAPEVWARSNRLIRERAERTEAAERERDHMRAALEQIPRFDSPEIRHWLGSQYRADVPTHIAQIAALAHAAIRARAVLTQPGNTQP